MDPQQISDEELLSRLNEGSKVVPSNPSNISSAVTMPQEPSDEELIGFLNSQGDSVELPENDTNPRWEDEHPALDLGMQLALRDAPAVIGATAGGTMGGIPGAMAGGAGGGLMGDWLYREGLSMANAATDNPNQPDYVPQEFLGGNPVVTGTLGALGGGIQGAIGKYVEKKAAQETLELAKTAKDEGSTLFSKALGASKKQVTNLSTNEGREPVGNLFKRLWDKKLITEADTPLTLQEKVVSALGGTAEDGSKRLGTLSPRINQLVEGLQKSVNPQSRLSDVSKRVRDMAENSVGRFKGTRLEGRVKASIDQEIKVLAEKAREKVFVPTEAGQRPLVEVYGQLNKEATKLEKLLKKGGLSDDVVQEIRSKLTSLAGDRISPKGETLPGLNTLSELFDNPPIKLTDLVEFKRGRYELLKDADYLKSKAGTFVGRIHRTFGSALKQESDALALKAGKEAEPILGADYGAAFKEADDLYSDLRGLEKHLPGIIKTFKEHNAGVIRAPLQEAAVSIAEGVGSFRHPVKNAKYLVRGLDRGGIFSSSPEMNNFNKALTNFSLHDKLSLMNDVPLPMAEMSKRLMEIPLAPKYMGLVSVKHGVTRAVEKFLGIDPQADADPNAELEQLANSIAASEIPPELAQDPQAVEQHLAMAHEALAPLAQAMKYGTSEDVIAAKADLTKQFPDNYEPPKTGIPGEVDVNGELMFPHPEDGMKYSERVKRADLGTVEKSKIRSDVHWKGLVSKVIK